jgi:hypothetical protein
VLLDTVGLVASVRHTSVLKLNSFFANSSVLKLNSVYNVGKRRVHVIRFDHKVFLISLVFSNEINIQILEFEKFTFPTKRLTWPAFSCKHFYILFFSKGNILIL